MKPIVHSTYGESYNFELKKSVEIFIDVLPVDYKKCDLRIFIAMEPDIVSKLSDHLIKRQNEFDYIFSFDENILAKCKNSVLFEFGTKWVDIEESVCVNKNFSISMVCGYKQISKNHILRKKIWYKQDKILTPKDFYISKYGGVDNVNNNKTLGDTKIPLFNSMFHICIENNSQKYYFSEKLIDCLLCKTIPIYVGCTNISEYFNVDGFIIANNLEEILEKCNSLTVEDYKKRIDAIEENYYKALNWIDYSSRLETKINELINK
jgi:hypothetical protein